MPKQKYAVNQYPIDVILSWVKSGEIAIPEIQRPFVWSSTKVRDLIDSLYQGYPIGYVIAWKNPSVQLKDGSLSEGKKILIDGQQRVTALTAAVLGQIVVSKDYSRERIQIAFQPLIERFEVFNPAIEKDSAWIPDIAPVITGEVRASRLIRDYCEKNPDVDVDQVEDAVEHLKEITTKPIGFIELNAELDIETVTEIFIRINSQGVVLSQADFAMSKIAANEHYGGSMMRKGIDYFCHLAVAPEFYTQLVEHDDDFTKTHYFQKMKWLKDEKDDLYDPSYTDLLRVAFTSQFNRGRLSDLVSLLSGRNFETRTYEEDIARQSFEKLETGILAFMNETNFKRFLMIIKSAGFIDSSLVRSQNTLNFAYILYLTLRNQGVSASEIETAVRRWFVYSILTGRYSGSPESKIDLDIRNITLEDFNQYLKNREEAELSDAFWNASLVQSLNTSVSSSPYFKVFLASQVKSHDEGFLSKDITVQAMIEQRGDIHHIYPKAFLKAQGMTKGRYNQVANYVYTQQEVNIKIGKKSPAQYFAELNQQCESGEAVYGAITDKEALGINFDRNCIPLDILDNPEMDYEEFLKQRRFLMAQKIRDYYFSL